MYTVKPGADIRDVIPMTEMFQYPGFVQGTVVFRNGLSSAGRLNYNILLGEIQFIDPKEDTLSLANEKTIRHVLISRDTFYYDNGYLKLVRGGGEVKLAKKVFFREYIQKPGSYDLSSATTATNSLSSILERRSYELNTSQEVTLIKATQYFIGNRFNEFFYADRKNILKRFSRHRVPIENYLNKNITGVDSEEGIIKLVKFLEAL
jgi:hypothetical protein